MKLVTFAAADGTSTLGAIDADSVADLSGIAPSMLALIEGGPAMLGAARAALPKAGRQPLAKVRLLAPVVPGKILCSGVNYKAHALENPKAVMPSEPFFFTKLPSSVCGPDADVARPARVAQMDYEVEFSAVIGKRLFNATEADVMPAIFGYTLLNDLSARDVQFKENQITLGKNFAGFAPIGPCIVTTDELTDPTSVGLTTHVNGRKLQDGSTSDWLFSLPRLISFLSGVMPLEPGDIVTTGTPAGVGIFQNPPVFLHEGDVVEIAATGIGTLRTRIVRA